MSKPTLQERMDEVEHSISVIGKELTDIVQILREESIKIEAIAAKIINNLSEKIDKCECSKEILDYLKGKELKGKELQLEETSDKNILAPLWRI